MAQIHNENPIDYTDLIGGDFKMQRSMSGGYSKRRSFIMNSKEDLPKITLSKIAFFNNVFNIYMFIYRFGS